MPIQRKLIPRAPGSGVGGFSAPIRPAVSPRVYSGGLRAMSHDFSTEEIRGKTGSAPSGAVLFGPFSLRERKRAKRRKMHGESRNASVCPERSSRHRLSANMRPVKTLWFNHKRTAPNRVTHVPCLYKHTRKGKEIKREGRELPRQTRHGHPRHSSRMTSLGIRSSNRRSGTPELTFRLTT